MDEKQELQLRTILNQTFNNENGIRSLSLIKTISGYDLPNVVKNTQGDLAPNAMMYNEGRRDVYLELRKYISNEILTKVEITGRGKRAKSKDVNKTK